MTQQYVYSEEHFAVLRKNMQYKKIIVTTISVAICIYSAMNLTVIITMQIRTSIIPIFARWSDAMNTEYCNCCNWKLYFQCSSLPTWSCIVHGNVHNAKQVSIV